MKTIKKYSSFEELKAADTNSVPAEVSLKKHIAFKKFIQSLLKGKTIVHTNASGQ